MVVKRKHRRSNLWKLCAQIFELVARKIRQFGGKSSAAGRETYFDILAYTALRKFIQFSDRTVGISGAAFVPVKRWPIIRKGVLTGRNTTQ